MPEDLPKAVMILLWLLIGTISVGALLMYSSYLSTLLFMLFYYGLPVLVYRYWKSGR